MINSELANELLEGTAYLLSTYYVSRHYIPRLARPIGILLRVRGPTYSGPRDVASESIIRTTTYLSRHPCDHPFPSFLDRSAGAGSLQVHLVLENCREGRSFCCLSLSFSSTWVVNIFSPVPTLALLPAFIRSTLSPPTESSIIDIFIVLNSNL